MNPKEATLVIGGTLTATSKMPCASFNLPAEACKTGSKLALVKGTPCNSCYAMKGRYRFPNGKNARNKRLASIYNPQWVEAMVCLLESRKKNKEFFRWHDSGDLQSIMHFRNIIEVVRRTPNTKHWLPTQERGILLDYISSGLEIPANMYIRVSATRVNGVPDTGFVERLNNHENVKGFIGTSTVGTAPTCPSYKQGGKCADCRNCWSTEKNIEYKLH